MIPCGPAAVGSAGAGLPVRRGRALLSVAVRRLLLPSGPPTANAPRGPLRVPAAPVPVVGPVLVRASRRRVGLPIVRVSRDDGVATSAAGGTATAALPCRDVAARLVRADAPVAVAAVVGTIPGLRLHGAAPSTPRLTTTPATNAASLVDGVGHLLAVLVAHGHHADPSRLEVPVGVEVVSGRAAVVPVHDVVADGEVAPVVVALLTVRPSVLAQVPVWFAEPDPFIHRPL